MKKIIVAGGRDFSDYELLQNTLDFIIREEVIIVSGKARGADSLGERYAAERGFPIEPYPADWKTYGNAAGPIRNEKMAKTSNALVAFWDGKSTGTKDMISRAEMHGLEVHVIPYSNRKRGTLYLASVSKIKDLPEGCRKLFIARKALKDMDKYDLQWVYRLAPSHELFTDIKSHKIDWFDYVIRFRKEMIGMQPVLDKVAERLDDGEDIALICYCPRPDECHRGILGNFFREVGYDVVTV